MRPLLCLSLLLFSTLAQAQSTPQRLDVPPRKPTREGVVSDYDVARLAHLEGTLVQLAKRDQNRRWVGWLQIGAGTVFGGAVGFARDPALRAMLGTTAAVTLGRGITELSLTSDAQASLVALRAVPLRDLASVQLRTALGERGLQKAASSARRTRLVEGCLSMFAAAAYVPLAWGLSRHADDGYRFGEVSIDYVGLSLSVIAFASGLVHALVASDTERAYQRYLELPR